MLTRFVLVLILFAFTQGNLLAADLKNDSISEYAQKAGEPKFTEWLKRRV